MGVYSEHLPQLERDAIHLTDGGLETAMIFRDGIDLPLFASCELFRSERGVEALRRYFDEHASLAAAHGLGFIIDTATWRSNPDWTDRLGYDRAEFESVNREAVQVALGVRAAFERPGSPMAISGVIGPRGDGYRPDARQTADQAREYHATQVGVLASTGDVDFIAAITMNYVEEAIGIALAARDADLPVVISFTVETDGALATGQLLSEAIHEVDIATDDYPAYFMVNCAHPTHLPDGLEQVDRLRGFRANASSLSHAELDEAEHLDAGDPGELGEQFRALRERIPSLTILGGCCGTDARHIAAIAAAL